MLLLDMQLYMYNNSKVHFSKENKKHQQLKNKGWKELFELFTKITYKLLLSFRGCESCVVPVDHVVLTFGSRVCCIRDSVMFTTTTARVLFLSYQVLHPLTLDLSVWHDNENRKKTWSGRAKWWTRVVSSSKFGWRIMRSSSFACCLQL